MIEIVKKLEDYRVRKKYSKSEISKAIGVSRSAFYKKLSGENNFTAEQLESWALAMDLNLGLIV